MTREISVILPTHNRAQQLVRTLAALSRQSLASSAFEVVVVADGCTDGTAATVQALSPSYRLILLEQPGLGAAAARNRGVAAASGRLLLLLDDDKEPAPDLLQVHLDAHARRPGGVVLGHYPIPARFVAGDPFAMYAKYWWDECFAERARPGHRFTFEDFCSGNVSLPADLYRAIGGFDEGFPNADGEDIEFGLRLLQRDIRFQFASNALSLHYERLDLPATLRRARGRGFAHVRIIRKHPAMFRSFNVHNISRLQKPPLTPLWRMAWRWPWLTDVAAGIAGIFLRLALKLRLTRIMWRLSYVLIAQAYWRGVYAALGSVAGWEQLGRDAHAEPASREISIDVASGNLDEILQQQPADSVLIYFRSVRVGRMPPVPGAERLAGVHVREYIQKTFFGLLLDEHPKRKQELSAVVDM